MGGRAADSKIPFPNSRILYPNSMDSVFRPLHEPYPKHPDSTYPNLGMPYKSWQSLSLSLVRILLFSGENLGSGIPEFGFRVSISGIFDPNFDSGIFILISGRGLSLSKFTNFTDEDAFVRVNGKLNVILMPILTI